MESELASHRARLSIFLRRSAALLGAALLGWSCAESDGPDASEPPPSTAPRLVILYAPCTVNKSFLSPYNPAVPYTPHLQKFAGESVLFRRHQTEAGQSGIAYASLFTGSQADHHGIYRHPLQLTDDQHLIAEAFAAGGYETFFWNDHGLAAPELNYDQGVEPQNTFKGYPTGRDPKFLKILGQLRADNSYRAFVLTNFSVTHSPYATTQLEVFRERFPQECQGISKRMTKKFSQIYRSHHRALAWNFPETVQRLGLAAEEVEQLAQVVELMYKSNVFYFDRLFGELVDRIRQQDLLKETLLVFTADHGEVLYRDNAPFQWSHSMQLAPEVLGVPLLIRLQDGTASSYDKVTRSIDVFPTMAGLCGLSLDAGKAPQGVDLSAAVVGQVETPSLLAYSHTTLLVHTVFQRMYDEKHESDWRRARQFFPDEEASHMWVSVRDLDQVYKVRKEENGTWVPEVFHLDQDPAERTNLYDPESATHREWIEKLNAYKARLVSRYSQLHGEQGRTLPGKEEAEALRKLGYVR
jgi:arylsulfatase A-like enzyme